MLLKQTRKCQKLFESKDKTPFSFCPCSQKGCQSEEFRSRSKINYSLSKMEVINQTVGNYKTDMKQNNLMLPGVTKNRKYRWDFRKCVGVNHPQL